MNSLGFRLLVYAQDAGGAQAILPVVQRLMESRRYDLRIVTHLFATKVFSAAGVESEELEELAPEFHLSRSHARAFLAETAPRAVFCTTSNNAYDSSNGELIRACRESGIPCFGLMDHWKGWGRLHREEGDFDYLPDALGVIDDQSLSRGIGVGIRRERLVVVGHPHLERLASQMGGRGRRAVPGSGRFVCTLFTQPFFARTACGQAVRPFLEGERAEAVGKIREVCRDYFQERGLDVEFRARLHPREQAVLGEYPRAISGFRIEQAVSTPELIRNSDLVLGLDSMVLYEALFSGCPVISLRFDVFVAAADDSSDSPGILPEARTVEEFKALVSLWEDEKERRKIGLRASDALPTGSVRVCERVLNEMLQASGRVFGHSEERKR